MCVILITVDYLTPQHTQHGYCVNHGCLCIFYCEKVAGVINCDYSETVGLVQKIVILISILKRFQIHVLASFWTEKIILAHA
jgi:hypothetical protein